MSTLYLIRHGQAGFAQPDYDVLSELGAVQARLLGHYCETASLTLSALYAAPRRRHRETALAMHDGAKTAGGALPVLLAAPAFDEFPFGEILQSALSEDLGAEYEKLWAALGGKDPLGDSRAFSRLFGLAMAGWVAGTVRASETFAGFTERVLSGLRALTAEQGRGAQVAVITSAGAISAVLMHLLELSPQMMLKLCLNLYNTGVSELRFRQGPEEMTVVSVNAVPHLGRPDLKTFR